MYSTKPRIYNIILVGPKIGRLSPKEKQVLYPQAGEEETAFLTENTNPGLISFGKKTKEKKLKGTLTKELFRFKIPVDQIMPDRRYELRIEIESMQSAGQGKKFTFKLDKLPQVCNSNF